MACLTHSGSQTEQQDHIGLGLYSLTGFYLVYLINSMSPVVRKPVLYHHMWTTKVQTNLRICAVWSAFLFQTLASSWSWAGRFVSYMVTHLRRQGLYTQLHYTPAIYAEGYIVFVFPFVCLFVHSYFRPVRGITSKFYVKATWVEYISPTTHQKAFIFGP